MSSQFPDLPADVSELSAEEFKRRLDEGERLTLLDTRRPEDFEAWHIDHPNLETVNVPFTEFLDGDDPAEDVPPGVPDPDAVDGPLVTCCAKGISSLYVAEFLAQRGWDVVGLDDGMRGWARLYESTPVQVDARATLEQFYRPSSGCLAYLVVSGDEAAVVDPLEAFVDEYRRAASDRGADLVYAIDTHVHADHVSGVRSLAARDGVEAVLPEGATDRGLAFDATLLGDGDALSVGETTLEAVSLPGHTTEMTGYIVGDVLLSGDTLFLDSVARPDLEDEDRAADAAATLYDTLQGLRSLPADTVVAPGHAGPSTRPREDGTYTARLGDLVERLDAFDRSREAFVEATVSDLPPRPNGFETIIPANLGRETLAPDEAFELELGPNNCAVE